LDRILGLVRAALVLCLFSAMSNGSGVQASQSLLVRGIGNSQLTGMNHETLLAHAIQNAPAQIKQLLVQFHGHYLPISNVY
jgi:hypothetical protein